MDNGDIVRYKNKIKEKGYRLLTWLWLITIGSCMLGSTLRIGNLILYRYLIIVHFFAFCIFIILTSFDITSDLKKQVKIKNYLYFLCIWYIWACISMLWSIDKNGTIANITFLTRDFSIIFFTVYYLRELEDFNKYLKLSAAVFLVIVFYGIYEVFSGNHLPISRLYTNTVQRFKFIPTSFFYNENDLGTFIVLYLPVFYHIFKYSRKIYTKVLSFIIIFISVLLMLLTGSRANVISLLLEVLILAVLFLRDIKRKKVSSVTGIILCITISVLVATNGFHIIGNIGKSLHMNLSGNENDLESIAKEHYDKEGSVYSREGLIKNGLIMLKRSHYLGVGAGNIEKYMGYYNKHYYYTHGALNMHNWWIEVLVSYGVPIFIMYMILYISMFFALYRICFWRKNEKSVHYAESLIMSMIALPFSCISSGSVISLYPVWCIWGFAAAYINYSRKESKMQNEIKAKKKICFIGNARSIHTQRWAEYFEKNDYDVTVISHYSAQIEGVSVIVSDCSLVHFPLSIFRIRHIIKKLNPDIVHGQQVLSEGIYAVFSGKKNIVSAWGSDVLLGPSRSKILKFLVQVVIHRAGFITSDAAEVTKRLLELGADEGKIATFPMGVSKENYKKLCLSQKDNDHIIFISPRNLNPIYNIDIIIKAFKKVSEKLKNAKLIITGDGTKKDELKELVNDLNIQDIVDFKGSLQHDEFLNVLRTCDIMVSVPVSDGTSVALLEGMAAGNFPIVSDLAANREWIEDCVNGYLINDINEESVSDAMLKAASDSGLMLKAAEVNRKIVKDKAIWEDNLKVVEEYYNS